jgi:glycerol-3-phosphate dehydrogenase subunit B
MQYDVVVIGGGLAGAVAAKRAAEAGATVLLVRKGHGATALSSGAFDVVGNRFGLGGPFAGGAAVLFPGSRGLEERLTALMSLNPCHPYRLLSGGDPSVIHRLINEVASDLFKALAEEGLPYDGSSKRFLLLATRRGRVKETSFAPATCVSGDLQRILRYRIRWLSVEEDEWAMPDAATRSLVACCKALLEKDVQPIPSLTLSLKSLAPAGGFNPLRLARRLDREDLWPSLIRELRATVGSVKRNTHLVLPPLFGMRNVPRLMKKIRKELKVVPVETLGGHASIPGLRLQEALDAMLRRRGVKLIRREVVAGEGTDGLLRRIAVREPGGTCWIEGGGFVLATGKFISGGLRAGACWGEAIFGLPLFRGGRRISGRTLRTFRAEGPADPGGLAGPEGIAESGGYSALFSVGVATDPALRPLDSHRKRRYRNLFAAGSVLGGYDFIGEGTGLGVAALTGFRAGERAVEAARRVQSHGK